ncbi:MAG: hypothetical protein P9L94_18580 [Candidatus Hinthialibacter antarcticus]|nr:hypothetical protein [Candidatus Hinthialibacter antarcticus]
MKSKLMRKLRDSHSTKKNGSNLWQSQRVSGSLSHSRQYGAIESDWDIHFAYLAEVSFLFENNPRIIREGRILMTKSITRRNAVKSTVTLG